MKNKECNISELRFLIKRKKRLQELYDKEVETFGTPRHIYYGRPCTPERLQSICMEIEAVSNRIQEIKDM